MNKKYLKWIIVISCSLLVYACGFNKREGGGIKEKPLNIGHAGMGFQSLFNPFNAIPDNSMRALQKAMLLGADGVEVDVQMSRDSMLILYHDKYLDSKTAKKGCINDFMARDVIGTPYTIGFPFDWLHDEKIISLEDLFISFLERDTFPLVFLDIHSHNYCDSEDGYRKIAVFARSLKKLIERLDVPVGKVFPTSTYPPMLEYVRLANPELKLLYEEHTSIQKGIQIIEEEGFDGMVLKKSLVNESTDLLPLKEKKIPIILFGGKSKTTIRKMVELGPQVIQVNNVKALKEILDEDNEN